MKTYKECKNSRRRQAPLFAEPPLWLLHFFVLSRFLNFFFPGQFKWQFPKVTGVINIASRAVKLLDHKLSRARTHTHTHKYTYCYRKSRSVAHDAHALLANKI